MVIYGHIMQGDMIRLQYEASAYYTAVISYDTAIPIYDTIMVILPTLFYTLVADGIGMQVYHLSARCHQRDGIAVNS